MASIEEFRFLRSWIMREIEQAKSIQHFYTRENCLEAWKNILENIDFLALYIYGVDFEAEEKL